ncbi:MAG: response regulator [Deltaproteobacteria bacterium]|jgi:signal transduction histidine kinase/DNA-binding response OmpR family regulator|nr:response regulator [Deltaproteobacteria bacterium]
MKLNAKPKSLGSSPEGSKSGEEGAAQRGTAPTSRAGQTRATIPFKLIILVVAAFGLMDFLAYFYVSGVVKSQIEHYSRGEITLYQNSLKSLILAHEAALQQAAATLALSFDRRDSAQEHQNILRFLTTVYSNQPVIRDLFISVYGYLDGNFVDGRGLIPGEYFNPKTAVWLRGALLTNGVFHSEPYIDPQTDQAVAAVSMVVYDQKGESRGVVALDFSLSPILDQIQEYELGDSGFGFLTDSSFRVLSFPDQAEVGRQLDEVEGFAGLSAQLRGLGQEVLIARLRRGALDHIGFFCRLENGWYLGGVAPVMFYYREVSRMIPVIGAISLALAIILSAIVWRLSRARDHSEAQSQAKTALLARLSSEVQGPLTAILGLSELVQRDYGRPEGLGYLTEIRRVGDSLMGVFSDLLDFAQPDHGRLAQVAEPYEVNELLTDLLIKAGLTLKDKPLTIVPDIDRELPRVLLGDARLVRQVLDNLMTNAIKHTPSGFIKLSARGQSLAEDEIRIFFTIEDSGVGLDREDLARVLGDYFSHPRNAGETDQLTATGLSLSLAKSLSQMMGGDLTAESEPGKGSKFTVFFVQRISDPTPLGDLVNLAGAKSPPKPFQAKGFAVLAVDDIASNLRVFSQLLEPYQFNLTTCLTGEEAKELARHIRFELVFIDHQMPGLDGVSALREIRAISEHYRKVPAIAFAAADPQVEENLLSHGFDDCLAKPVAAEKLAVILDRWVPLRARQTMRSQRPDEGQSVSANVASLTYPGWDVAEGIERCGRSQERFLKVLEVFVKDAEELEGLLIEPEEADLAGFSELAVTIHALRSGAAYVGAGLLSQAAARLETAAKERDRHYLSQSLGAFRGELKKFVRFISQALRGGSSSAPTGEKQRGF